MSTDVVLRARSLTKRFGSLVAVDGLDLEVHAGEVYGLLGPNGSGKSTTVGMFLGLLSPSAGEIETFGLDFATNRWEVLRHVGAIVESPAFYPYLSGRDNLRAIARVLGTERLIDGALARVGLSERAADQYRTYSLGMKQRLGIASTLIRDPRLIILDEPTNGLDPAGTREVRSLIPELAREGRTVVLCSHVLHEVELVCDRAAILDGGSKVWEGPLSELTAARTSLSLRIADADDRRQALEALEALPWVEAVRADGELLLVTADAERAADLNRLLAERGIFVSELTPIHPSLEGVFFELTGDE